MHLYIATVKMEVDRKRTDIDLKLISNVPNSVNTPNNFLVMNPVKIKSKHKIYKLQKSGSLINTSVIDRVVMACKDSDKNEGLRVTDKSQRNNYFHAVCDGLQLSSISGDINESSSASFSLDNYGSNKQSSLYENTIDSMCKGYVSDTQIQQPVPSLSSKIFAKCTKAFTNKHVGPLDSADPYQKKKQNTTSKTNRTNRKGKSSMTSLVKKRLLPESKYCQRDGNGSTIQQLECCDETAIATIALEKTKQEVPVIVAQGNFFQALEPDVPSSASTNVGIFKGPETTVVDGNYEEQPKTKSVKSPSTQKKRKGTYNHLNEDSPQMPQHQRYDQLVASPCMNTVDLSFKMQNSDISTVGRSNKDRANAVPANISEESTQTDCTSEFILHKNDSDLFLLGCKNTSHDKMKSYQLTEDSREFVQHEICTKLRTPSKCVVVLPEELRESTDKSAALLSGYSLTTSKSEAIQNLDEVLSQKRSRDLSPANMSSVRLSKDVVSSPVHKSLQLSDVRLVKSNEKASVMAEWKQTGSHLLQTLNSAGSETELEDQTLESNSDLNVSVFPFSVLFPNTTFSNSSEERSLSLIFDDERAFHAPSSQLDIFKACQGGSMSLECENSGATAERSVSSCFLTPSKVSESFPPAEESFRDSIKLPTNSGHLTKGSTCSAFHAEELHVRSSTQTLTEVIVETPHISPNYDAALSLHLSPEDHCSNGDNDSLDKLRTSVGADLLIADDMNGCSRNYVMKTNFLARVESTIDSSQSGTSHAAQHDGACSYLVSPQYSLCKDESLSSAATKKVTKGTSYSTTSKENEKNSNDQCVSKETASSSLGTDPCDPTFQKPGIQTRAVKKVWQGKSCTSSKAAVKNVDKITISDNVKPKKTKKLLKNVKHRKSISTRTQHEKVEKENCTTFLTKAVVQAHAHKHCLPGKLQKTTVVEHARSDQHSSPKSQHETRQNEQVHNHSDKHCTLENDQETPLTDLMHTQSEQHHTLKKRLETLQNELAHAHSNLHCAPEKEHNTPQNSLSSDARSGIVLRSGSKSTPDHLAAALDDHNPMLQTPLIPIRSCNKQESSSLYWFSEVVTTYAYGAASSTDLQRLDCVSNNKLLTNAAELTSCSSNITGDSNNESVNICDSATTNSSSTNVTECTETFPCNNCLNKSLCKSSVSRILGAGNSLCEQNQIDGTGNLQQKIISPSNALQKNLIEWQDTLHDSSILRSVSSTTALVTSDDDCDFEGFQSPDPIKTAESATESFDQAENIGFESPLLTSVASDENCCNTINTTGIKRSSNKRTEILKKKRSLHDRSLDDLVLKDRLRSIHKFSSTKGVSRLLNECTSSYMDNVTGGKISSLERGKKNLFQKEIKKICNKTINPVRQIEEKSNKLSFPKSRILVPLVINNANVDVSPTSNPNSTTTTSIGGSSEHQRAHIQSSETGYLCTAGEYQPSTSSDEIISTERSLHKSTNTSFDMQDHNDNHLDYQSDQLMSDITCNKTAKGCTVRCRDPRSDPPGTPYECLTCRINNSFQSLVSLLQHIMVVHANAPTALVGESDGSSLMPADCVDTIASSPHWVEIDPREANEQTKLVDSACKKDLMGGASNGQHDDVDECSEKIYCSEVLSSQLGASDCSSCNKDKEVFAESTGNGVVNSQEQNHCNSPEKRSDAALSNVHKKVMHSVERKSSCMHTRRNETGDIKMKKNITNDENLRRSESGDANKLVNELGDANIAVNNDVRGKITSPEISVNNDQFKTFAVNRKRSRFTDANGKNSSVTHNRTRIKPIDSTFNNSLLDNADKEQRSRKRKRRAGRKNKKAPCLQVKTEYKPPPIVMNPCRPRKGFIVIPSMTPDDVERLVSVQRKAFNETFKMKRREIIANNKEAGIDVSKQMVMVDGRKRYQCEKCTTSVSTAPLLLNHMVTHYSSELAKFSCAFCPKTFHHGTALKRHLEKHGNIMRFFCPICNLGLQQESNLRYHLMLHAKKKRTVFGCKKCDMKFNSTALLAGHSKVHYPNLKYRCRECDFVCIGRGGLSKHVKAEHKTKRANNV